MKFLKNKFKLNNIILLIFSLLIISFKWIYSFTLHQEDIVLRVIYDTYDNNYYPLIKAFSDLNFNPGFSERYEDLKLISFPVLSLAINSLFFKIFGGYSFIILEFICVFLFLIIFFNILIELGINQIKALFFSLILFSINKIFILVSFLDISFIEILKSNFTSFYSLRFPRPILTNLFLYAFIYFLIKFYKSEKNSLNYLIPLSLIIGVSLNSFFYHAINEFVLILIVFFYKFKNDFFRVMIKNYKIIFLSIIIGIFFLAIFIFQINLSEDAYTERLGVLKIENNQKLILLNYFQNFIIKKEFIILFVVNTLIFYFTKSNVLKIFYFVLLSSLISTIFVFLTFNKGIDYYHFINFIVIHSLLHFILFLIFILNKISIFTLNRNIKSSLNVTLIIIIISFIGIFDIKNYQNKNKINNQNRADYSEFVNFIKKNDLYKKKNLEIFNFNYELSIWFILHDFNNFSVLPVSFWTSKNNDMLEYELNSTLNFFEINLLQFDNLIKNQFKTWRYKNDFVYNFFGRKYLANNFTHYNQNLNDYTEEEKKYILKNNLLISHQIIIPKNEINRLKKNFLISKDKINPNLILIDKKSIYPFKKVPVNYSLIFENKKFKLYYLDLNN
tara:strand:- start:5113 stop:6960 length:1848 start_codon:yes stop_codon:yes gene_type:complete